MGGWGGKEVLYSHKLKRTLRPRKLSKCNSDFSKLTLKLLEGREMISHVHNLQKLPVVCLCFGDHCYRTSVV